MVDRKETLKGSLWSLQVAVRSLCADVFETGHAVISNSHNYLAYSQTYGEFSGEILDPLIARV